MGESINCDSISIIVDDRLSFSLVGGESITIDGERIIKDVFRETFDVCLLCSFFL